jgi:hypothetical protein
VPAPVQWYICEDVYPRPIIIEIFDDSMSRDQEWFLQQSLNGMLCESAVVLPFNILPEEAERRLSYK